jgi:glycosyltransferase involved in cell wall biosynthesis
MSRPHNLCCIISSLGVGGAERVMSLLANEWAAVGARVTIVTFSRAGHDAYHLDPRVERVGLDLEVPSDSFLDAIRNNVRKLIALRKILRMRSPDVAISFIDKSNVLTLLSRIGLNVRVVVSERVYPPRHAIGPLWSLLRRLTYRWADALVIQSEDVRAWAQRVIADKRIRVIPNPISDRFLPAKQARGSVVLGVGRLDTQKGFDILIRAFATLRGRHPEWSLVILGRGPHADELKDLAARLLPVSVVIFGGNVTNPADYYRSAGLFVLSSRYEGFPNALLEAMASGCAVIATNCPGGTAEIVRSGTDGLLVPPNDVDSLAKAMDRLMNSSEERERLGEQATDVSNRFAVGRVHSLWNDVIAAVSGDQERFANRLLAHD